MKNMDKKDNYRHICEFLLGKKNSVPIGCTFATIFFTPQGKVEEPIS
jgi:hypothetical protein